MTGTGATELLLILEAVGVMVSLNASGDGLKLSAATPPPAELLAQIRAAKPALLEYLAAQQQPAAQKNFPDWALIGAQAGHCGSCIRWTEAPAWGPLMGQCSVPAQAWWPETSPLSIHMGHICPIKRYRAK